jgi:hypothetical protein
MVSSEEVDPCIAGPTRSSDRPSQGSRSSGTARRRLRDRRGRYLGQTRCCGAPVFASRPWQCVHEFERFRDNPTLGLVDVPATVRS